MSQNALGKFAIFVVAFVLFLQFSCSSKVDLKTSQKGIGWESQNLLDSSKTSALAAMNEKDKVKIKELTQKGIGSAEDCLSKSPENAGCYYWRAVNTGLYYKAHVVGYQRGIKQMIADCKKVIEINPKYENAGAYRMLGQLYAKLPQSGLHADNITRDLALSEEYLKKAVQVAPNYPENQISLAETLLSMDNVRDSEIALSNAKSEFPNWQDDISFKEWIRTSKKLEKKIERVNYVNKKRGVK